MKRFSVVFALALLGGCASMSSQECMVADWETIGYEDGVRGQTGAAIGRHRKACAKAGIAPDRGAYERGRQSGLEQFCQPENGFRLGSRGADYSGACPAGLEGDFLAAFAEGQEFYGYRAAVNGARDRINHNDKELKQIRKDLKHKEARLVGDEASSEERAELLAETRELYKRQGELEEQQSRLTAEHAIAERELREYEAANGFY